MVSDSMPGIPNWKRFMPTLMIALGLIGALANSIFAEEEEEFLRELGILPHEIWACDGLRSDWNRVNEPFILEGTMKEYRFKYRGSETVLKLIDEERAPIHGSRIYAGYMPSTYDDIPDKILGVYFIWCNVSHCDEASKMKVIMVMLDQPNREGKCLKMN